jgi:hypothetical protein
MMYRFARVRPLAAVTLVFGLLLLSTGCPNPPPNPPANTNAGGPPLRPFMEDGEADPVEIVLESGHEYTKIFVIANCTNDDAGEYTVTVLTQSGLTQSQQWQYTFTTRETRAKPIITNVKLIQKVIVKVAWKNAPNNLTAYKAESDQNVPKQLKITTVGFQEPESRGIFTTPIGVTIVAVK